MVVKNISDAIQGRQEIKYSNGKMATFIQEYSLRKILNLNTQQYIEDHSAIRQQVVDRGEDSLISLIETLLLSMLPVILTFTFSIIAISFYSKMIGIYSLILVLLVIFATVRFNIYFKPLRRKNIDNWDRFRKVRVEAFEHLKLIRLFGMENSYVAKYLKDRADMIKFHV
jgi:ABC-type transport system involved in Fe-S cluster assembly fused permease/ATPase subunit